MVAQPHRTTWPDERLDGLNLMIRESVLDTRRDLSELGLAVDQRFREVDKRIDRVERGIFELHQTIIWGLICFLIAFTLTLTFITLANS